MKKLMFAAATAAVATGAFATAPTVYTYRATVNYLYVKTINVRSLAANANVIVYQKYKKSATLNGFLIQDTEGVTSPTITPFPRPATAATAHTPATSGYDHGRNRAFLIVSNNSAEQLVRRPKILPAVLETKWLDTRFTHTATGQTAQPGTAEGTLFVGGELVASNATLSRPKLDTNGALFGGAATPAPYIYADYLWTSVYLFGEYNGPQWSGRFLRSQTSLNLAMPRNVRIPAASGGGTPDNEAAPTAINALGFGQAIPYYHDTWMNHAGIGTYTLTAVTPANICCGLSGVTGGNLRSLDSLSGNLKGGIFICSDNGFEQANGIYRPFLSNVVPTTLWEDQFFAPTASPALAWGLGDGLPPTLTLQADIWTDGNVDQMTTDVAYGTWDIRRTTLPVTPPTPAERAKLVYGTTNNGGLVWADAAGVNSTLQENANYRDLIGTIKTAAQRVSNTAAGFVFINTDGTKPDEIYDNTDLTGNNRFDVPFLTPRFARTYGLARYGL